MTVDDGKPFKGCRPQSLQALMLPDTFYYPGISVKLAICDLTSCSLLSTY